MLLWVWTLGLALGPVHTLAVQVERPWEFMAKGLDFALGLWRLHTMPSWRLRLLYFIGYFQLISLDSQQSLATQSHGLSTWTAIVWTGPKAKVHMPSQFKMLTFWWRWQTLGGSLGRTGMEPNLRLRGHRFIIIKISIIGKILAVRLKGLFRARNIVTCSFGFGLWAWPLEASHYASPKTPLTIFSAHFFGLSTKFGHNPTASRLGQP
jgi:hypothetical protein